MKEALLRNGVFLLTLACVCIFTSILVVLDNNAVYCITSILPISFLLCHLFLFLSIKESCKSNIAYILFFLQSFAKCVLGPLFLFFGDYSSLFSSLIDKQSVANSVILLIYEQFACSITILLTKESSTHSVKNLRLPKVNIKYLVWGNFIIITLLWLSIPSIRVNFTSVFDMLDNRRVFSGFDYASEFSVGNVNRICTTLFLVLFKSFRIIFPFYIIKKLHSKFNSFGSFIFSILIISVQFLFIPSTMMTPFINSFLLLSYLISIYEKYRKEIYIIGITSIAFVVLLLSIWFDQSMKWYGINSIPEYISMSIQGYVPGVCNTACIFKVERNNRLKTLMDTIVACIPFQSSIFGSSLFSMDLNTRFVSTRGLASQIVSTIGGGWYFFGYIFSPIFSVIFTRVSIVSGYKYKYTDNETNKLFYLFMCIQSILGIGIYNIQITITSWLQIGLVLFIISELSKYKEEK